MRQEYTANQRLSQLIDSNPMILMTMSRFGLSLGFGDKSVEAICSEQGVDCGTFLAVINFETNGTVNVKDVSVASLMAYLQSAHDYFIDFCLPRIRRKLIEALDCSDGGEVGMMIVKYYDNYVEEVRRHMDYENDKVFGYVKGLLDGVRDDEYSIAIFSSGHHGISDKLRELKEIIVRYLPRHSGNLLNSVLFDIINCQSDLSWHCRVEDKIFVPVVEVLEKEVEQMAHVHKSHKKAEMTGDDACELSKRERDIIYCVAQGLSNKEIADKLCISVNTVTTHRRNIAQKLEIHSAAGLAIYAVLNGIVDIQDMR